MVPVHNQKGDKMKVSVNVNDLNRMLKTASKLIDSFGMLAGELALSVHDGMFEVIVVALNGQCTELRLSADAGDVYNDDFERVPAEDGFCVVRVKDLAPLKTAKKGSEIVIEAQKDIVHVITPDFAYDVPTACDPAEFPDMLRQLNGDPAETLEIVPNDCGCFKFIIPAISQDTARPDFTGAALRGGALISTDSHRLHYCPLPALFGTGELAGIISPELLKFIADGHAGTLTEYREQQMVEPPGYLKHRGAKAELQTVATWHVLEAPGVCIKSRPIRGMFPDFMRVIPNYKLDETAEVDAKTLANAIKPLYAGWKINLCMTLRNTPDGVELKCKGKSGPKSGGVPPRTAVLKDIRLPHLPVALNPSFIMDALNGVSDRVTFCCIDQDSPVWIGEWSPMRPGRGAVIMPMELF